MERLLFVLENVWQETDCRFVVCRVHIELYWCTRTLYEALQMVCHFWLQFSFCKIKILNR